jgi:threonine dehydratase
VSIIPAKDEVLLAYKRVEPHVHKTPVLTSTLLNEIAEAQLFFKCENFQRGGSFKMRGAANAILQIPESDRNKGVVTHSSGNFAQAVSLAAKSIGVPAYIVMPKNAPQVKVEAVKGYGGQVTLCESTLEAREKTSKQIEQTTGATFVHPSNDIDVILGQGTASLELINEVKTLNTIITPVGGGGLLAGTALATSYTLPNCRVIAGEPIEANDAYRSLQSGNIEANTTTNTIADGLRTTLDNYNFPIIKEFVNEIICVTEQEIINAMKLLYERMKIVVEPSSAVALAAILKNKQHFQNQKIGIILSGGNVDVSKLPF